MPQPEVRFWHARAQVWLETWLDLIFPSRCASCGRLDSSLCQDCRRKVARISGPVCFYCGQPRSQPGCCARCLHDPLPLKVRSFAWYQGPLIKALLHLKYKPSTALARRLAEDLAEIYRKVQWPSAFVAPVPLASERMRQRGYNQAELIASALSDILSLPYLPKAVSRVRETRSQVGLSYVDRRENVRDAFRGEAGMVRGQVILVVDDLFTTGATLISCAQALLDAGAKSIYGLTVGRARGMET